MDRVKVVFRWKHAHTGHWDGIVHTAVFTPHEREHPGPGGTIRWGCWELNFWKVCGAGRSWKEAASVFKRWAMRNMRTDMLVDLESVEVML